MPALATQQPRRHQQNSQPRRQPRRVRGARPSKSVAPAPWTIPAVIWSFLSAGPPC